MKTTLETTTITTTIRIDANDLPALAVAHMIAYGLALRGVRSGVFYGVTQANTRFEERDGTLEVSGFFHGLGDRERFNGLFLECASAAMQAHELACKAGFSSAQVQS